MIGRKLFRRMKCPFWWSTALRIACQNLSKIYVIISNYEIVIACSCQRSNQNRDKEFIVFENIDNKYAHDQFNEVTSFSGCKSVVIWRQWFPFVIHHLFSKMWLIQMCDIEINQSPMLVWRVFNPDISGAHHSKFMHFCVSLHPQINDKAISNAWTSLLTLDRDVKGVISPASV